MAKLAACEEMWLQEQLVKKFSRIGSLMEVWQLNRLLVGSSVAAEMVACLMDAKV